MKSVPCQTNSQKEKPMETGAVMFVCAVTIVVCGLIMRAVLKKKNELFEKAIAAENTEDITKNSNYGKVPFIIALIIGALAAGTIFVLIMTAVFSGTAILFTG